MKKIIAFILSIFIFVGGCGISDKLPYNFDYSGINEIHVYSIGESLIHEYSRKIVTSKEDIQEIVDEINNIRIKKVAKRKDIPAGGLPMYIELFYEDGSTVVCLYSNILIYADEDFVVKEDLFYADEFWLSLNYDSVKIEYDELPTKELFYQ